MCARLGSASAMNLPDAKRTYPPLAQNHFQEAEIMNSRRIRNRSAFGFESLEIRNAPSHFGVVAHAAAALHPVHAAAHVRHITDSEVNHKKELKETSSSVDSSQDTSSDPSNSGSTAKDPSNNDPGSVDPKSDR
jgi:hypothetical protein